MIPFYGLMQRMHQPVFMAIPHKDDRFSHGWTLLGVALYAQAYIAADGHRMEQKGK